MGVLLTILLMIGISMLAGVSEMIEEAFQGDWMQFDEPQEPKADMDNSEFDWGHNVKHRTEEEV